MAEILNDPGRFGLSADVDQSTDCLSDNVLYPCNEVEGFVSERFFLDGLDLTTTGHALLADQVTSVINAPVLVSGVPLTAIATGREIGNAGLAQVTPELASRGGWAPFVSAGVGTSNFDDISGEGDQGAQRISGVAGVSVGVANGVSVGVAAGYQNYFDGDNDSAIDYDGSAFYGTAFAGADLGRVFGSASVTVGYTDYDDVTRVSRIGAATIENSGSTDATTYGGSLEVGVRALTNGSFAAGPIASLDYYSADVDGYREDAFDSDSAFERSLALEFGDLDADSARGSFGLFVEAGDLDDLNFPIVFRAKALYTRDFNSDGNTISARAGSSPDNSFSREGRGGRG